MILILTFPSVLVPGFTGSPVIFIEYFMLSPVDGT